MSTDTCTSSASLWLPPRSASSSSRYSSSAASPRAESGRTLIEPARRPSWCARKPKRDGSCSAPKIFGSPWISRFAPVSRRFVPPWETRIRNVSRGETSLNGPGSAPTGVSARNRALWIAGSLNTVLPIGSSDASRLSLAAQMRWVSGTAAAVWMRFQHVSEPRRAARWSDASARDGIPRRLGFPRTGRDVVPARGPRYARAPLIRRSPCPARDERCEAADDASGLLRGEAVGEQRRLLGGDIGAAAELEQPLEDALQMDAEEGLLGRHARVEPLFTDRLEAEREPEEVRVPRGDLEHAVVARPDRAGEEIGRVEEARERALRRGVHVEREVHELAHPATVVAEHGGLVAVEVVRRQAARGIEADAQAADELARIVGEERIERRILQHAGNARCRLGVPHPERVGAALLEHPGEPDLQRALRLLLAEPHRGRADEGQAAKPRGATRGWRRRVEDRLAVERGLGEHRASLVLLGALVGHLCLLDRALA